MRRMVLMIGLSAAVLSTAAQAHRLNVFAYSQAGEVCVEAGFANGSPARGAQVNFINEDGESILKAVTSNEGKVCAVMPANFVPAPLTVVVNAGEGHQNQWKMSKEEFLTAEETRQPISVQVPDTPQVQTAPAASEPKRYSQKELDQAVAAARNDMETRVVGPLKRELALAKQPQITFRDILGGIGWLVGLGGIFAWLTTRRKK